jgi:DNA-binding protein H-NS
MKDILLHTRKLQAAVNDFTTEELGIALDKIGKILNKRKLKEHKALSAKKEKLSKIEEIKRQMKQSGISMQDFDSKPATPRRKNTPRPAKYLIVNSEGVQVTWTGQGRMPNVFKTQLENGKVMDEFLI